MKRTILLNLMLLILFCNSSYGQDYKFDKIVKSKLSFTSIPNHEDSDLFNSKDYSYYMQLFSNNDSIKARIFDNKNNQLHNFYVVKSDSLKFYYLNTSKVKYQVPAYTYDFSDIQSMNGNKEIILTVYNANRKIAKYTLNIEENNQNFFPLFNLNAMEAFQLTTIKPPLNFTVLTAKGSNRNGKVKYELISIKDVAFEIKLPEKLIIK